MRVQIAVHVAYARERVTSWGMMHAFARRHECMYVCMYVCMYFIVQDQRAVALSALIPRCGERYSLINMLETENNP
jgi:hypothetical protein